MFACLQGVRAPAFRSTVASLGLCGLLALSACGGGGDDKDNAALPSSNGNADAYVGTWLSTCLPEEGLSGRSQSVVTKVSANQVKVDSSVLVYGNATCSGAVVHTESLGFEIFKLTGTKTVGGKLVDKVVITGSGGDEKALAYTNGPTLWLGDDDSTPDSEGYPTALDTSFSLQRQ